MVAVLNNVEQRLVTNIFTENTARSHSEAMLSIYIIVFHVVISFV